MPLNGSGTYTPPSPEYPAIPNTTILASDWNTVIEDLATALSLALYKDGQAPMAANFNMASYKIVNLANGTADGDAVNHLQVFTDPTFTGVVGTGVVVTGTKFTVTPTVVDILAPTTNITSATAVTITSPDASIVSSNSADITATSTITLTAPTVTAVGNLVATMDASSTGITAAATDNTTKLATNAFVQQVAFNTAMPAQISDGIIRHMTSLNGIASWEIPIEGLFYFTNNYR